MIHKLFLVATMLLCTTHQAMAQPAIEAPTNGALVGYLVVEGNRVICRDPEVWNQIREFGSFIVCNDDEAGPGALPPLAIRLPDAGRLVGYEVQVEGHTVCSDPLVARDRNTGTPLILCQ